MGDNDVQMEFTGQTQESQTSSADKIDLSLDDIIKLNKQEQRASRSSSRANSKRAAVLKKLNQIPQQQRGHRRGAQQYQGPGRLRGFRRQRGSGRGMMSRGRGVSAMNSAAADSATTGGQFDQTTFTSRGTFRGRGRGRGRGGGLSRGALSARGQRTTQRGGRPFVLDGGFSATRAEKLEKYQKIRSRRTEPSGSTLTVSLPNAKSAPVALIHQTGRDGAALRGRSSRGAGSTSPKGIPLHFNYRATTNQTGLSLNDRFSDLRFIGRGRGRVRGRGRGRGDIAGGGQGRGNISQGARGRGNISQGGRGRGNISQGGRGRGNILQGGRGRGNILQSGRGRGYISQGGRGRGYISQGGRGRGYISQGGRGRGNILQGGRGRGNILQGGRGRGNISQGGRGRGGFTRGRGLTRQGRGGSRVADRTVTLQ